MAMDERDVLVDRVVDRLTDQVEAITQEAVEVGSLDIASYGVVPMADLRLAIERNVVVAVQAIRDGSLPEPEDILDVSVARARLELGVSVDDMIRAYRLCINVIRGRFEQECMALGVPAEAILRFSNLLWAVTDIASTRISRVYYELEVAEVLRDVRLRDSFVRRLSLGMLGGPELARHAAAFGLDLGCNYVAVRARLFDGHDPELTERLRRSLETDVGQTNTVSVVGIVGDDCVGVIGIRRPLLPRPVAAVIGLGPPVRLGEISNSFDVAAHVLEVGLRRGRPAVMSLDDVSWRTAVEDHGELVELLRRRYLEPLGEDAGFRPVLIETLRAYLANGRSVRATAHELFVHENTLRYRLARFEELTGCSLNSTDVLIEISWVIEATGRAER